MRSLGVTLVGFLLFVSELVALVVSCVGLPIDTAVAPALISLFLALLVVTLAPDRPASLSGLRAPPGSPE